MSLFSRRKFIFLSFALGGCSFSPAFKSDLGPKALKGKIKFSAPKNREDYMLISRLEENFGPVEEHLFNLSISYTVIRKGLGSLGNISRYNLLGKASFSLSKTSTDSIVLENQVNTFTSYSASAQTLATETAGRAAKDRLMRALADQITDHIIMNRPLD
jgi:LPS-assembly lipoprotein